jgi:hypothetical protein
LQDYLAKPVKGKLLEKASYSKPTGGSANVQKMLVKWALEGRRKTAKDKPSTSDNDRHGVAIPNSKVGSRAKDHPREAGISVESETTALALTAELDRLHYQSDAAFARSNENEGERAMRRIHAEERDTKLRDEKLLSLVGPQLIRHNSSQGPHNEPSMPLTEANIEKLVHEQDADSPIARKSGSPDELDSNRTNNAHSMSNTRQPTLARPGLEESRHRDSERTIVEHVAR